MAAKSPVAKTAKGVKTSQTTKAKSHFTSRQRQAYQSALKGALRNANQASRASAIAQQRLQAALARQRKRNVYVQRTHAKIVRNTYLQARYGVQNGTVSGLPLKSRLANVQAVRAYLQVRYGKKTYAITTNKGSVRVQPRVKRGKVVAAGKRAVSKSSTSAARQRTAAAVANRAARQVSAKAPAVSRPRKAARRLKSVPDTPWVTAGNDEGEENCVAVAIANSCLYSAGYRPTDEQVRMLKDNKLNRALWKLWYGDLWFPAELYWYRWVDPDEYSPAPGDIVGFKTPQGDHCGVLLPKGKVISWGEVVPLKSEIDEAWTPVWKITD